MRALLACAPLIVVACADESMLLPDAAVGPDGQACAPPDLDPPWLRAYVSAVVGELAAAPRATAIQRTAARNYLQSELAKLGLSPQLAAYATGANVEAVLPATGASAGRILVGAHFDSVPGSPGANDNATGVAAVLAVGRMIAATPCRTHEIVLVLFDEEETGLTGARAYAASLGTAELASVHTIDQIGWDQDGDRRFELELPSAPLEAAYRAAAGELDVPVAVTSTEGTDHQAFRERGLSAIGLTEEYVGGDTTPYRHTPQDVTSTVDVDYLALGTRLVAHVIARTAGGG